MPPKQNNSLPLKVKPKGYSCKPTLLLGLPSGGEWAKYLSHILIHDIMYSTTSTFMGEYITNRQDQLDYLLTHDGKKLLDITKQFGGSVIASDDQIIKQQTLEVNTKRLKELTDGIIYQAVIVDDTYFIREPQITKFVMDQYAKGSSIIVMTMEGIFDLSVLRRNFNVDWNLCAYTTRSIELTDSGSSIIGGDAFPYSDRYVKANFVTGEGQLFTEHLHPGDYEDEEDYPNGPPPPEPGSPIVTVTRGDKSVSYFGFVNPSDVSYGAILLKLCYVTESVKLLNSTANNNNDVLLPLQSVKVIAQSYGWKEVDHNKNSRMISFKKESTRINVYYTTGTVGTCLNHPKSGKTQLFRRDITINTLKDIFLNPRVHTGGGYYKRKNITQKWKLEGKNVFLSDSARRWQYVAQTTGLMGIDSKDMKLVQDIVTEWESLYWDAGDQPDLERTKFSCGSRGGLLKMMYQVANSTCGCTVQCWSHNSDQLYAGESMPYNHKCDNLASFLQSHQADVMMIKVMFNSLSRDVRIELMQWFMGRECVGMHLADEQGEVIFTKWSLCVHYAHIDYGEIMYPKKAGLCSCCGILTSKKKAEERDYW